MAGRRIGLTTRLALVGIASALVPFVVGGIAIALLPDEVAARNTDQELQQALALASARAQEHRADLAFELARLDDEALAAIDRAGNAARVRAVVRASWARRHPGGAPLDVVVLPDGELVDGGRAEGVVEPIAASIRVRPGTGGPPWVLVAWQPGMTERIVGEVERATDVAIEVVRAEDGAEATVEAPPPARSRTQALDADRGLWLVGTIDGTPLELLLRGRGQEFRLALLLLLGAGLLCAVTTALVMNRLLSRIAATAERMSSGDFDTRLDVVGTDAGARVATSLNGLAAELQHRIGTLEDTVDRLDRTLAAIDDGVCTWSVDDELETWNQAAAALTGTSADEARAGAPAAAALRTARTPGRRRVLLPLGDGESHLAVDLFVRRMQDGGTLQVFRDAAPALSIEQARSNFLVTAAHELRTPLTSILGFAATLDDEHVDLAPEVRAQAIRHVLDSARRLADIVQSLFESSLLVRDRIEVALGRVDLLDAIDHVVEASHVPMVELLGIDRGEWVRADRAGLERALAALLDNAAKYGAAPIELELERDVGDPTRVAIVVRDHGSGIPANQLEAVFEPFHRVDPEMLSDVGGAGMGLYNARRLLGAMDATVVARHVEGTGSATSCTEFVVELQRWHEREAAPDVSLPSWDAPVRVR